MDLPLLSGFGTRPERLVPSTLSQLPESLAPTETEALGIFSNIVMNLCEFCWVTI